MELTTQRLTLRLFTPSDITDMYLEALNDMSVVGRTEARHQRWNRESASDFIRAANCGNSMLFAAITRQSQKPIGNVRLFNIHPVHRRGELSLLFYDKSEWSKGYGTEAVEAVVGYAFDVLGLHRIVADYYSTNLASSRMFENLGFVIEGVFKDHFLSEDSEFVDSVRVARLNDKSAGVTVSSFGEKV